MLSLYPNNVITIPNNLYMGLIGGTPKATIISLYPIYHYIPYHYIHYIYITK